MKNLNLKNKIDEDSMTKIRRIIKNASFLIGYKLNKLSQKLIWIKELVKQFFEGWSLYDRHVELGCN